MKKLFLEDDEGDNKGRRSGTLTQSSTHTNSGGGFKINEKYAEQYEEKKKKEELSQLEDKYRVKLEAKGVKPKSNAGGDYDKENEGDESFTETDSEEDVVEDEDGDLVTPALEAQILQTIARIRAKDSKIYDPEVRFFEEETFKKAEDSWQEKKINAKKEGKPLKLKDFHREKLLNNNGVEDASDVEVDEEEEYENFNSGIKTHEQEQKELKEAFKSAAARNDEGGEDSLLKVRNKSKEEKEMEDSEYKKFLLETLSKQKETVDGMKEWFSADASREENFLVNYVLTRGWVDKRKAAALKPTYEDIVGDAEVDEEEDEEAVEKMEEFELAYNFRYEQPDGDKVVTYARSIEGSTRRPDTRRKDEREARKLRQKELKDQQKEELKRLKNLKKQEIKEKLEKIQAISGTTKVVEEIVDLEGDFDGEEHDRRMKEMFDEEYYGEDDVDKPVFSDADGEDYNGDEEEEASPEQVKIIAKASKSLAKAARKALKAKANNDDSIEISKYLDEYYQLDYEDMIGGDLPCRFKYQTVKPSTFGLKIKDILRADDDDLNAHISLKKLAPYRPQEMVEGDETKYASTKKLCKFYDLLKRKHSKSTDVEDSKTKKKKTINS